MRSSLSTAHFLPFRYGSVAMTFHPTLKIIQQFEQLGIR